MNYRFATITFILSSLIVSVGASAQESFRLKLTDFKQREISSLAVGASLQVEVHLVDSEGAEYACDVDYDAASFKIVDDGGTVQGTIPAGVCRTNLGGLYTLVLRFNQPGNFSIVSVATFRGGAVSVTGNPINVL